MHPTTRITTFFNLTPHTVCIILASGETLTIDPQPVSARVEQSHTFITPLSDDGDQSGRQVALAVPTYGAIIGLPAPVPTVAYIVSVFVANAAAALGRTDVVYPDSGPDAVRKDGQVVAVRRLLAPLAPPAPLDPYRTPGVLGEIYRLLRAFDEARQPTSNPASDEETQRLIFEDALAAHRRRPRQSDIGD